MPDSREGPPAKRRTAACRSRRLLADSSETSGGTAWTAPARGGRNYGGGRRSSAGHRVRRAFGGSPRGVSLNSEVMTSLHFDPPATFDRAIENLLPVLRFLEIIAGRRQNLMHLEIELDLPKDCPRTILKVYSSSPPNRTASGCGHRTGPRSLSTIAVASSAARSPTRGRAAPRSALSL